MATFIFANNLNLPNVEVKNLDDVVKHIAQKFKMGYKYYFICEPEGQYYDPTSGKTYPYAISCRFFPMTGGHVAEFIVGYSYVPIPNRRFWPFHWS